MGIPRLVVGVMFCMGGRGVVAFCWLPFVKMSRVPLPFLFSCSISLRVSKWLALRIAGDGIGVGMCAVGYFIVNGLG